MKRMLHHKHCYVNIYNIFELRSYSNLRKIKEEKNKNYHTGLNTTLVNRERVFMLGELVQMTYVSVVHR